MAMTQGKLLRLDLKMIHHLESTLGLKSENERDDRAPIHSNQVEVEGRRLGVESYDPIREITTNATTTTSTTQSLRVVERAKCSRVGIQSAVF